MSDYICLRYTDPDGQFQATLSLPGSLLSMTSTDNGRLLINKLLCWAATAEILSKRSVTVFYLVGVVKALQKPSEKLSVV
jgi:hypothetical protein